MFANALNRLIGWWKGTLAAERSFLRAGGGPGCPPISNEQQLKRDLALGRPLHREVRLPPSEFVGPRAA